MRAKISMAWPCGVSRVPLSSRAIRLKRVTRFLGGVDRFHALSMTERLRVWSWQLPPRILWEVIVQKIVPSQLTVNQQLLEILASNILAHGNVEEMDIFCTVKFFNNIFSWGILVCLSCLVLSNSFLFTSLSTILLIRTYPRGSNVKTWLISCWNMFLKL